MEIETLIVNTIIMSAVLSLFTVLLAYFFHR